PNPEPSESVHFTRVSGSSIDTSDVHYQFVRDAFSLDPPRHVSSRFRDLPRVRRWNEPCSAQFEEATRHVHRSITLPLQKRPSGCDPSGNPGDGCPSIGANAWG